MRFFELQGDARARTRRLLLAFALTVLALVLAVNAALALAWWVTWGAWAPAAAGFPRHFFAVNTAVVLLFVLGGWWLETSGLVGGGHRLARRMGARELRPATSLAEQRFGNTVDEMAIAAGMRRPTPMVVARAGGINAFATGWGEDDAVVAVTQGALDRLTREELQGVVAHEFSHLLEGDTRLNMRLAGMVSGLEMVYRLGLSLWAPDEGGRRTLLVVPGLAVMVAGWLGWLAGHALQAAVSRERELLADARAVQWTRSRDGLGQALRKLLTQQDTFFRDRIEPRLGDASVQHLLLVNAATDAAAHWLDSHPPLGERIRRIYGRPMGGLPLQAESPPAAMPI